MLDSVSGPSVHIPAQPESRYFRWVSSLLWCDTRSHVWNRHGIVSLLYRTVQDPNMCGHEPDGIYIHSTITQPGDFLVSTSWSSSGQSDESGFRDVRIWSSLILCIIHIHVSSCSVICHQVEDRCAGQVQNPEMWVSVSHDKSDNAYEPHSTEEHLIENWPSRNHHMPSITLIQSM